MKNIFLIISICCFAIGLSAQPISSSTYGTMLETAEEAMANKNYLGALEWWQKAYDDRKDKELIPKIANVHYLLRDYAKASNYYKRLFRKRRGKKKEVVVDPQVRFNYARVLKMTGNFDGAIEQLQNVISNTQDATLKELAEYELNGAEFAKIARPIPRLNISNIGSPVNSPFSEYSAVLTGTGEEMYFAGFDRKDIIVLDGEEMDYHAKIYVSQKKDDKWGKPTALGEKINRPGFHTANVAMSEDGRRMYFTRQVMSGNEVSTSQIFYAEESGEGWGAANELGGVNGEWIAKHPAIGELFGKEVIFFISDMDGGQGGLDIYYATHKGNGIYGDPVNLGPKINTAADEETPFYRNGTLYFSSMGHPGLGGFDIFNTTWDGVTWSEPKNMGKGYNSNVDDKYFTIDKEGYHGTFLSNREGGGRSVHGKTCCDDIWEFTIEKINVDVIAGAFDVETKKPLIGANFELYERVNGELIPVTEASDPSGNVANFPLLLNKSYVIKANALGYKPAETEVFTTVGITTSKKLEQRLRLEPLPKEPEYETVTLELNEPIRMNNIYYDYDDDKILTASESDLGKILGWMNEYPDMVVELSSHTDSRGRDAYNEDLSQRRAESAKQWLVTRGVSEERIKAVGYGEKQILNRCTNAVKCSDEEHRFNRRTEFKILSGPQSIVIKKTERRLKVEEPKVEEPKVEPKKKKKKKKKRRRRRG